MCVAGDTFVLRATAANVVEVLNYSAVLNNYGIPRTWQDMTGSRASATGYTNSTGREIEVAICTGFTTATDIVVTVAGIAITRSAGNSTGGTSNVYFKVPAGATYSAAITGYGGGTWAELR